MNKSQLLFDTDYDARIGDCLKLYGAWLESQSPSLHTRREYLLRVKAFLLFLWRNSIDLNALAENEHTADSIMQLYHRYLQLRLKSVSVDAAITAIDSYFRFLGQGKSRILKYRCNTSSRKILSMDEHSRFRQAIGNCKNIKHRAICTLVFYAGIGLNQCASLNYDDIDFGNGGATITVRNSDWVKRQSLPEATIEPLEAYLDERAKQFAETSDPALFLNNSGRRMSRISIYNAIRNAGHMAQLEVSARVLQNTISAFDVGLSINAAARAQNKRSKKYASVWKALPFQNSSVITDSAVC